FMTPLRSSYPKPPKGTVTIPTIPFDDTAATEIYTLSLHDALPISGTSSRSRCRAGTRAGEPSDPLLGLLLGSRPRRRRGLGLLRSEEHTSELQSRENLVCRLLLEKKKLTTYQRRYYDRKSTRLNSH